MRLLFQLVPLYAASTALAKEPAAAQTVNYGYTKSQDLLGSCSSPLCLNEDGPGLILEDIGNEKRELAAKLWKHSEPCQRNGTKEYCAYVNPDFAGRGIAVFTSPSRAVEIAESAAFKNPETVRSIDHLNAAESPRWHVEEVPGKGMGLIASRNILMGDHIMSTSASVMIDYDIFYDLDEKHLLPMQVKGVNYLPEKHLKSFLNLSTHDGADDYEQRVNKVILTNSFDITDQSLVSKNEDGDENFYTVFPESKHSSSRWSP